MLMSMRWVNQYLDTPISAADADHALTHAGFPIEGEHTTETGDEVLDVELTSNRGDCLCHVGLAREIAAATGRSVRPPAADWTPAAERSDHATSVANDIPDRCPRFAARVIRGVKVGPSPAWLREKLEAIGVKSISNVVDATNYVLFELGHPSHVFDLARLDEGRIVVRNAHEGEKIVGLDEKTHALTPADMVVADANKAVSIAGVMGGLETSVTGQTTDILLEIATWNEAAVRTTARRLGVRTDASHRYERTVSARDLDHAADRLTALIIELAGGEATEGLAEDGPSLPPPRSVTLRLDRCNAVLGIEVPADRVVSLLSTIGIDVSASHDRTLRCGIPNHRPDLTREIDLIEEVIRLHGFDHLHLPRTLAVPLDLDHPPVWDRVEGAESTLAANLVAAGFYETVTFSFERDDRAALFVHPGLRRVKIDEDRRRETPMLRPSVLPGLLNVRAANQAARVHAKPAGHRFFELASAFAEADDGEAHARDTRERRAIALLADAPPGKEGVQEGLREMRGVIEAAARALGGNRESEVRACEPPHRGFAQGACAEVSLAGETAGHFGLVSNDAAKAWNLDSPAIAAELFLEPLVALYPPVSVAHSLPAFPGIERDLSVVVDESVHWADIRAAVVALNPDLLTDVEFVGVYRGKQAGAGKKSVTLRLLFRDPDRTLRHEEVDPQVEATIAALSKVVNAEIRQ